MYYVLTYTWFTHMIHWYIYMCVYIYLKEFRCKHLKLQYITVCKMGNKTRPSNFSLQASEFVYRLCPLQAKTSLLLPLNLIVKMTVQSMFLTTSVPTSFSNSSHTADKYNKENPILHCMHLSILISANKNGCISMLSKMTGSWITRGSLSL